MNFQDDFPSIPFSNFEDHFVLVFDLTCFHDANEIFHYRELVGEPESGAVLTYPLEHVTELSVLGERTSSVANDKFGVVRKHI